MSAAAALQAAIAKVDHIVALLSGESVQAAEHIVQQQRVHSRPRPQQEDLRPPLEELIPAKTGNKKGKPQTASAKQEQPTGAALFVRARLQVAQVIEVDEIDSEKLYKTQVNIGGGETRQILAGLKKHIRRDALLQSHVIVVLNLKTAKLAGQVSEGMILAAVDANEAHPNGELVHPLVPPECSVAGDTVFCEGCQVPAEYPKVLKSDHWKQLLPFLRVQGGLATCDSAVLRTDKGSVCVFAEFPDGASIS